MSKSTQDPSLWTAKRVAEYAGVSSKTILNWSQLPGFPKPIRIGRRYTRWYAEEIVSFFENQRRENATNKE